MIRKKKRLQKTVKPVLASGSIRQKASANALTPPRNQHAQPSLKIDTDAYQQYRDELAGLLAEAQTLPRLLPESASKIDLARRKLYENQFEITLVGEFQGGKSTTFNNLCDGREISPRGRGGGGLKTSGCIIRAQNLADPNEGEHAIVHWRTPAELLMGFNGILTSALTEEPSIKADEDKAFECGLLAAFDPSTAAGRKAIRTAAEAEIKKWNNNRTFYDPDGIGRVDLIRFGLITAHYFDSPVIRRLRKRERFSVNELQSIVRFPEDWETRWEDWNPGKFAAEEVAFSFIASVDCRLHSPNLARLGCAVTDCPGLFASAWDTKVARDAIHHADAVLYLVQGDRALGLSNLRMLASLPLAKGLIFVGTNCRTQSWNNAAKVLDANRVLLANQGLEIKPEDIRLFHAALALFSQQMERGIENLDATTLEALRSDFGLHPTDDVFAVTRKLQRQIGNILENLDTTYEESARALTPRESYIMSRLPSLLEAIERFVVSRKGRTTLVGNGERVNSALIETEGSLRQLEDSVNSNQVEREREFKKADDALQEFENRAKALVGNFGQEAPDALAQTFWEHVNSDKERFVNSISSDLAAKIKEINWTIATDRELLRTLKNVAQDRFEGWLEKRSQSWLADISRRGNQKYNDKVLTPLAEIYREFEADWKKVVEKRIPSLDNIEIPALEAMQPGSGVCLPADFVNSIGQISNTTRHNSFVTVGVLGGVIAILVALVVLTSLTLSLYLVLVPVLIFLFPSLKSNTLEGGKKALEKKLSAEFANLKKPLCDNVSKEVKTLIDDLQDRLVCDIIEHPRRVYNSRKKALKEQFQLAEGERIKAANEAKLVRQQQIAPLRARCESFLAKVRPLFE